MTENDFAPGFVPAGGSGDADVYPGYLLSVDIIPQMNRKEKNGNVLCE